MSWISVAYLFVLYVCSFLMLVSNGTVNSMILISIKRENTGFTEKYHFISKH